MTVQGQGTGALSGLSCGEPCVEFVSVFGFGFTGPDGSKLIGNLIFDILDFYC